MQAGSFRDALVLGCCRVALHIVRTTLLLIANPVDVIGAEWIR